MNKLALVSVLLLATASASFAAVYVYPANGQSPEQQAQDQAQCHGWAVSQSGYDPHNPPPAPPGPSTGGPPQTAGAGGGAVGGAIIGGIVDGSDGAWKGAAIGGLVGGVRRQREYAAKSAQQNQYNQQTGAWYQQMQSSFDAANKVCLEGRGYTVS
ncbi:MAG: hypothetical protein DHS20C11_01020 [Lysobacteraceae bacterium]|nr:MAG: hypothetical protein DHS20C11_01020 [Xanthomonadaceae bacterium]